MLKLRPSFGLGQQQIKRHRYAMKWSGRQTGEGIRRSMTDWDCLKEEEKCVCNQKRRQRLA